MYLNSLPCLHFYATEHFCLCLNNYLSILAGFQVEQWRFLLGLLVSGYKLPNTSLFSPNPRTYIWNLLTDGKARIFLSTILPPYTASWSGRERERGGGMTCLSHNSNLCRWSYTRLGPLYRLSHSTPCRASPCTATDSASNLSEEFLRKRASSWWPRTGRPRTKPKRSPSVCSTCTWPRKSRGCVTGYLLFRSAIESSDGNLHYFTNLIWIFAVYTFFYFLVFKTNFHKTLP